MAAFFYTNFIGAPALRRLLELAGRLANTLLFLWAALMLAFWSLLLTGLFR